ncbi:MAG: CBS domain-containing protein [Rhodopila sp.]
MRARDVMATEVATVAPNASLHAMAETMVERGATGLPVVDGAGRLLGLVTESDLLHCLAAKAQAEHGYLRGVFHSISRQADEYARSHGHFAADVMTPAEDLVTATEDTTAEHLVKVMEERRIRYVPVVREGGRLVGVVTYTHLLRAVLQLPERRDTQAPDNVIHREVIRRMREQPWANSYFTVVDVRDGVVRFSGFAGDGHVERGLRALAEEVQGVKEVVFTTEPIPPHSAQ